MSNILYFNNFRNPNLGKVIKKVAKKLDKQTSAPISPKNLTLIFTCTNTPTTKLDVYFSELTYYLHSLIEKDVKLKIIVRGIFLKDMEQFLNLNLESVSLFSSKTSFFEETGEPVSNNQNIIIF